MADSSGPPPPPPRPPRHLDTIALEGLDDLVDSECSNRDVVKSLEFEDMIPSDVHSSDVEVVLFDYNSVDSFAAAYAAKKALGSSVIYYGVNLDTIVEDVDIQGRNVVMLGVCWPVEAMHELVSECRWLILLDNHISSARELENFRYPNFFPIIDIDMGAGALAWNFFHATKAEHVPALFRALEDAELGRKVLRDAHTFEMGYEAAFELDPLPRGDVQSDDDSFERFEKLIGDDGGRSAIQEAIEQGRSLEPGLQVQCTEAAAQQAIAAMREFPAWRCVLANVSSPLAGKIAESLCEGFIASSSSAPGDKDDAARRCFAAVFEVRSRGHVRVILRSAPGGPDVSEIAAVYDGIGHGTRAFFSLRTDVWDTIWVQPELVLWDVRSRGASCLSLQKGDSVVVARAGERIVRECPFDEWSWGYCTSDPANEGWIPTLAHTLLIATSRLQSQGKGIQELEEGDTIIARRQRGNFLMGWRYRDGTAPTKGWYPRDGVGGVGKLRPLHASTSRSFVESNDVSMV